MTGLAEYVTDVPYVRAFENDLSPARVRLAAALNGFAPPPADGFDYCELGSAHGDTTATLAAAYPRSRFVGVDLNAEHIASANRLSTEGQLENIRFLERDFEDLPREDLPDFDFITAHGVLSWVGPVKRKAVLDFASAKLRPGGLLHVSYNALPGWAPIEPLRQLIAGRASLGDGDSLARARAGLDLAKQLAGQGAEYFTSNPAAQAMLAKMEKLGLAYIAHEYLHAHWVPMYFAQVAAEMAAVGLYFVGQLPPYLNYRDLAIPPPLAETFRAIDDRVAFESLKDFALNEYFRRDVFIKGRAQRSDGATRAYLDATPFGGPLAGGPVPREVKLPYQTIHYAGAVFDALLPAIEAGATTLAALASRAEVASFGEPRVRDAVLRLTLGEAVVPMLEPTRAVSAPGDALYRLPSAYNRLVLREGLSTGAPITLASRAAGTGLELSTVEGVALFLLTEVPGGERRGWVQARCGRESFRLTVRGQSIAGKDEQVQTLLAEVDRFSAVRMPRMLELGVVDRA